MNKRSLSQRARPGYGASGYRGVSWCSTEGKWKIRLKFKGKCVQSGTFKEEIDALRAINKAYAKWFPEYPELYQVIKKQEFDQLITGKWVS